MLYKEIYLAHISRFHALYSILCIGLRSDILLINEDWLIDKKHLKNVGPIRHCEPPHAACFTLPFTRCRYCRTPPLSHAVCASMSKTTTTTTMTTRDRGDRYGPIEWAQLISRRTLYGSWAELKAYLFNLLFAGDSLTVHRGQKFSTRDQDNDVHSDISCSVTHRGAWWYAACHHSNLNGAYMRGRYPTSSYAYGVDWNHWTGYFYSLRFTEMKIRPFRVWVCDRKQYFGPFWYK